MAPPFVGTAVNVTLVPVHMVPVGEPEILTEAAKLEMTTVIELEVTVAGETQFAFEVICSLRSRSSPAILT